jgi:hypothetical protein
VVLIESASREQLEVRVTTTGRILVVNAGRRHGALTNSRPCANVTLLIRRVAHLLGEKNKAFACGSWIHSMEDFG